MKGKNTKDEIIALLECRGKILSRNSPGHLESLRDMNAPLHDLDHGNIKSSNLTPLEQRRYLAMS